jgi:hypothetical protein
MLWLGSFPLLLPFSIKWIVMAINTKWKFLNYEKKNLQLNVGFRFHNNYLIIIKTLHHYHPTYVPLGCHLHPIYIHYKFTINSHALHFLYPLHTSYILNIPHLNSNMVYMAFKPWLHLYPTYIPLCLVMHSCIQLTLAAPIFHLDLTSIPSLVNNVSVKETHVDNPNLFLLYTKTPQPTTN